MSAGDGVVDNFGETKVNDLYVTLVIENVAWLQVVVNDFVRGRVHVPKRTEDLDDDSASFFLCHGSVGFEVSVEVDSFAVLHSDSEGEGVDGEVI